MKGKKRGLEEPTVDGLAKKERKQRKVEEKESLVKTTTKFEIKVKDLQASPEPEDRATEPSKRKKQTAGKREVVVEARQDTKDSESKPKRARKTKEAKDADAMPLAVRTAGSKLSVGAHVSAAGGVHNAIMNSVIIGANAFALFLRSQRKWANPPLADDVCKSFIDGCAEHKVDAGSKVVPHGSYLVNLAHTDAARSEQAYETFQDDLRRCHKLGIKLYNFHPGNSAGAGNREAAISHLASQLNRAHKDPETGSVITLLETMATRGNTIGGTFEDIQMVIKDVEQKDRVGVCLDTCHIFAAGYDMRTPEALTETLDTFEKVIGLKYLKALHVNDSKAPLNSNRDLHANIGTGFLGLRAFHALVNEPRLWGLPMILETPIDVKDEKGKEVPDKSIWAKEIKLLESLVGMDSSSEGFIAMEAELNLKGTAEREKIEGQVTRKLEKALKKDSPKKKRRKGNQTDTDSD